LAIVMSFFARRARRTRRKEKIPAFETFAALARRMLSSAASGIHCEPEKHPQISQIRADKTASAKIGEICGRSYINSLS